MTTSNFRLQLLTPTETRRDPRIYNLAAVDEVAALIVDNDGSIPKRQIVLHARTSPGQPGTSNMIIISALHPSYNALRYPVLFPAGEQGWHTRIPLADAWWAALPNGNTTAGVPVTNDD